MEHQVPTPSEANGLEAKLTGVQAESVSSDPGEQAIESLVRAIAQEFVIAFDEMHDAMLAADETENHPRVQAAGS